MNTYWYRAYGLRIESEVRLSIPQADPAPEADLVIRFDDNLTAPPSTVSEQNISKALIHATPQEIYCKWPAAGVVLIREGKEIRLNPEAGAGNDAVAPWIQGAALSLVLHQRGFLVLHSSAVSIQGRVVSFIGQVGWGKSTTAAAMSARGHQLLADDVVAVRVDSDARPWVVPGFPHLKLMTEAVSFLGENPSNLPEVADDPNKRLRISRQALPKGPLPLAAVYILDEGEPCEIVPIQPMQALLLMMDHLFVARMTEFLRKTDTMAANFRNLTELIRNASVCKLRRPKNFDLLPSVAEMVEKHALGLPLNIPAAVAQEA